jgi:hypothetical protein
MPNPCDRAPAEQPAAQTELVQLLRRIEALTLELHEAGRYELDRADIEAKERLREQLQWQLAAVARRTATDDLGDAA